MNEDDIKRCYDILIEGVKSNNLTICIECDDSPLASILQIIYEGEYNIPRLVNYFNRNIQSNMENILDLKAYGIDPYILIRDEYIREYKNEIIIESRNRIIGDVLKTKKDIN